MPKYQRGYRWGPDEVLSLLNDISESDGEDYYLQPLVVKARPDGSWELVDGQQRLTTLCLILQVIKTTALPTAEPGYSLEYETRPGSPEYLKNVDESGQYDNIDYFHIYGAFETITNWFQCQPQKIQAAIDFYSALSKRVYVIWYEAPDDVDQMALFRRLNVGRIPLTDAELVKALLLSQSHGRDGWSRRSEEIAAHWDSVERDLRNPDLWAFVTGESGTKPTHISLLLDTLGELEAGGPIVKPRPQFFTFETLRHSITQPQSKFWDRVVDLHSLIVGWYEDRNLYHKIGYLVATRHSFLEMVNLARDKTKSEFDSALDELIRADLSLTASEVGDLSYSHESGRAKCVDLLLLMNVEATRKMQDSTERYSFQRYAAGAWSLEHIHAQSAEQLNRAEQWEAWLKAHQAALLTLPDRSQAHEELSKEIDAALPALDAGTFRALEEKVVKLFAGDQDDLDDDSIHSISNLALLAVCDNSALSNAVFEVKRQEVLRRDRAGSYIPVATRNAFLKYYTKAQDQQLHFWSLQDRSDYLDAIVEIVAPYLSEEGADS